MNQTFDIYAEVGKEIQSFNDKILIAGKQEDSGNRYLSKNQKGYFFNQKETLDLIDLYYNSKYETGEKDSEGQRKLFLNICAFRSDVASKMIDLDTKDFVFIPDNPSSKWGAYFIQKEFKDWAKENYFGEFINELVENYPKYGTLVTKNIGKRLERVDLKNLVNPQNCKDLKSARFVIEIHKDLYLSDMKKYKDWDLSNLNLKFGEKTTVYERYGEVPLSWFNEMKGISANVDENETIEALVVCTLAEKKEQNGYTGSVLFIEECKQEDRPYEEVHWKRQDGRWLGIGEVENQFENQIARNMLANLRRRALLWSSKKIFQSPDETIAKNLIRDVKDGEVLRIMPNGNITQVDMASRQIGEFQSAENLWEDNSNQKSFTYEAATGESMPSGTSFRLGVVLSNAVNSHFKLKKQKLGLFLKRVIIEQVFDIFKKENSKEHIITLFGNEDGINNLKEVASNIEFNKRILEWALSESKELPNFDVVKSFIGEEINKSSHLFVTIPDKFYDEIKHHIELVITGEEIDVNAKIQSLTTLYQSMVAKGDPRADQILDKIMAYTGENLEAILGKMPVQNTPVQPKALPAEKPKGTTMNDLANMNAPTNSPTL